MGINLGTINSSSRREILFRARSKEDGQWVEGNYHHNIRKGEWHGITDKEHNTTVVVYRESLQMKGWDDEWEDV